MTMWKNWIIALITVCAILSVVYALLPKGKFQTIARCGGAMVLLLVAVKPIIQADWSEMTKSFSEWSWELNVDSENYCVEQNKELERIIAEKSAAYIEEKAASIGVACHVQVECTERDGIPLPTEIVLDIPYNEELSEQICADLDIKTERQYWQKGEK